MKLNTRLEHTRQLLQRHKLTLAISSAIAAALLLTIVSIVLYNVTGSSKLDLSRPGYDIARKQVKEKKNKASDEFKSSGSLTPEIMKDYLHKYQQEIKDLGNYDDFSQKLLDDGQLGLGGTQLAPSDGAVQ